MCVFISDQVERPVISAPSKEQEPKQTPMPKINTLVQKQTNATNTSTSNTSTSKIPSNSTSTHENSKHSNSPVKGLATESPSRPVEKRSTDKSTHREDRKDQKQGKLDQRFVDVKILFRNYFHLTFGLK